FTIQIMINIVQLNHTNEYAGIPELFNAYMVFYQLPADVKKYDTFLSDRLSNQEAIIFLAIDDNNKAVGLVLNYVSFSTLSQGKIVILNDLFVDSAYRNRRIGRELIERTFEFAKSINAVRVDISTSNK